MGAEIANVFIERVDCWMMGLDLSAGVTRAGVECDLAQFGKTEFSV